MSKVFDKPAIVRMAWCTALRRDGHRQCRNTGRDDFGNVCFMGLLREITNAPQHWSFGEVGALAGLSYDQVLAGIFRNDGRCGFRPHTFNELAAWVEGLPRV